MKIRFRITRRCRPDRLSNECRTAPSLLTRYRDVEFVYKNPKIFSSDKKREFGEKFGFMLLFAHHTTSLVFNDPPLHTRIRRLINGALTPRAVAQIQPDLENWLID